MEGFTKDDADSIQGGSVHHKVTWKGRWDDRSPAGATRKLLISTVPRASASDHLDHPPSFPRAVSPSCSEGGY